MSGAPHAAVDPVETVQRQYQDLITKLSDKHDVALERAAATEAGLRREVELLRKQLNETIAQATNAERDMSTQANLLKKQTAQLEDSEARQRAQADALAAAAARELALEQRVARIAAESTDAQFELQRLRKQLAELNSTQEVATELAVAMRQRSAEQTQLLDQTQTRLHDTELERDRYRAECLRAQTSLDMQTRELERHKGELVAAAAGVTTALARVAEQEDRMLRMQHDLDIANGEIERFQRELVGRASGVGDAEAQLAASERERRALLSAISDLQQARDGDRASLEDALAARQSEVDSLTDAVRELASRVRALQADAETQDLATQRLAAEAEATHASLRRTIAGLEDSLAQAARERQEQSLQLRAERDRVAELKLSVGTLVAELAQQESAARAAQAQREGAWKANEDVAECGLCGEAFGLLRRKHHCRVCGGIFCHACSAEQVSTPRYAQPVRACNACVDAIRSSRGRRASQAASRSPLAQ